MRFGERPMIRLKPARSAARILADRPVTPHGSWRRSAELEFPRRVDRLSGGVPLWRKEGVAVNKRIVVAAIAVGLTSWLPGSWAAGEEDLQVRQDHGVSYVSGGVGDEERERIQAFARDFNLELLLVSKSGAYLANVDVVIKDARGKQLLAAKTEGPLFYAKLPKGHYKLEATKSGETVRKTTDLSGNGQRKLILRFSTED
jgi:hypothetical protein